MTSEDITRAQEVLHKLAANPAAVEVWRFVEEAREECVAREAVRAIFERRYISERGREIEKRAEDAERRGREAWAAGFEEEGRECWATADEFWAALDDLEVQRHATAFYSQRQR